MHTKFVDLFEKRFIETQESDGMRILGQFSQLGMPNKFYWLRGFSDMKDRGDALTAFYYGPVWRKYRTTANPMLLENDNVLLLQPAHAGSGFQPFPPRAPQGSRVVPRGLIASTIYYLGQNSGSRFDSTFETQIRPIVESDGAKMIASFITDHARNSFPKLPIRSDANVFVWISCFSDRASYEKYASRLANDSRWWTVEGNFALAGMYIPPEVDLLRATPRSLLNCAAAH